MNRADLIHSIRHSGKRRLPARARRMAQPDAIRRAYFSALRNGFLRDLRETLERRLVPLLPRFVRQAEGARGPPAPRTDADQFGEDDLHDTIDEIAGDFSDRWTSQRFAQTVQPFAQATATASRTELAKLVKEQIGVDVVQAEPWLPAMIQQFTRENVALIKSIPPTFFADLEKRLISQIGDGVRHEEIAADLIANLTNTIGERVSVSESRANLIARDQVGKFFGETNRVRQEQLGVRSFVWRSAHDNRVRREHEARDGETFAWDTVFTDTTDDGPPGQPINCRCYAEPDLTELFAEAGLDD